MALFTRLYRLGTLPNNLVGDEADNLTTAYHILAGTGPGLFGIDWKPAPAFSAHVLAAFLWAFGATVTSMRLPSALASAMAVIPFFFMARRVVAWPAALAAALLMSTNVWFLNFSRSGWENAQTVLFELIAYYFLARALSTTGRQRWLFYGLAALGCLLGLYGYFAGVSIVIAVILVFPFALLMHLRRWRDVLLGYLFMGLIIGGGFLPQWLTIASDPQRAASRINVVYVFSDQNVALNRARDSSLSAYFKRTAADNFDVFFEPNIENIPRYAPLADPLLTPALVSWLVLAGLGLSVGLFVAGIGLSLVAWRRKRPIEPGSAAGWVLGHMRDAPIWWLGLIVPWLLTQLLTEGTPDPARGVIMVGMLFLFAALTLDVLTRPLRVLSGRYGPALQEVALIGVCIALVPAVRGNWNDYLRWANSPELAAARQPAVAVDEFELWQRAQMDIAGTGGGAFSALDWNATVRMQLGQGNAPTRAGPPAAPPRGASASVVIPKAGDPRDARLDATIGADTSMQGPRGLFVDPAGGSIYTVDTGNVRILHFSPSGALDKAWGKRGTERDALMEPFAVAVSAGKVLVLDASAENKRIVRFDSDGNYVDQFMHTGEQIHTARGLAIGPHDRVYIASTGFSKILTFSSDGAPGEVYTAGEDGKSLEQPTGIAVAEDGTMYVIEPLHNTVVQLNPDGTLGGAWYIEGSDTLHAPQAAVMRDGNVVMSNPAWGPMLRIYTPDGTSYTPVNLLGLPASPSTHLSGVAVDASGSIYTTDYIGNRILRWKLT